MVEKMFADVPWTKIGVFVEFGPGTGRFTQEALARLGPKASVIAIDTSAGFTQNLRRKIRDPRLHAVEGGAQEVRSILADRGFDQADCILSGLPFSTLAPKEGDEILDASCSVLSLDGRFLAYQMREAVKPLLEKRFFKVDHRYEWRNIPPCHLYSARRPRAHQRSPPFTPES
jgi:phospholipid N-methyltransferase